MGNILKKTLAIIICFSLLVLVAPLARAQSQEAAVYTTTMNYNVQNVGPNQAVNARATIYLFDDVAGWANQEVISESITVDGNPVSPEVFKTEDSRWTQISLDNLSPGQTKSIKVVQVLMVSAVDLKINPGDVGTTIPSELMAYTQPVDGLFESNDPSIQALAKQLSDNTSNLYYKARQIFDFVLEDPSNEQHLRYERQQKEHSALWALQNKVGDCTEFSDLFVALLRAVGIPAKLVAGFAYLPLYNLTGAETDASKLGHAYSIFYLPHYGWVPADAVWPKFQGSFGETDHAHIVGASVGGEGAVRSRGIVWPGPGTIEPPKWQQYVGQETTLEGSWSGTITPEILVDSSLQAPSQMKDDTMTITLTVKNMGRSEANDLMAELVLDSEYFEPVTASQQKTSLVSQEQWVTSFDVRVKEVAYGTTQRIDSKVTFNSSDGGVSGTFISTGSTPPLSISDKPSPAPAPSSSDNMILYIGIGAVVALVAVVAVLIKRR